MDTNGITDAFDNCPAAANSDQGDGDADRLGDPSDNCLTVGKTNQPDLDGDGIGNACESDCDGGGVPNVQVLWPGQPPRPARRL